MIAKIFDDLVTMIWEREAPNRLRSYFPVSDNQICADSSRTCVVKTALRKVRIGRTNPNIRANNPTHILDS